MIWVPNQAMLSAAISCYQLPPLLAKSVKWRPPCRPGTCPAPGNYGSPAPRGAHRSPTVFQDLNALRPLKEPEENHGRSCANQWGSKVFLTSS